MLRAGRLPDGRDLPQRLGRPDASASRQGFEVYKRPPSRPLPASVQARQSDAHRRGTDEGTIEAALEFLRINGRKRWFLYLHLMDVHEYLYDEDSALFGTDHAGHLRQLDPPHRRRDRACCSTRSPRQGYRENTLIVIASDHGEAFGERGFEGHAREVLPRDHRGAVPALVPVPPRARRHGRRAHAQRRHLADAARPARARGRPTSTDGRSRVPEILALARGEAPPEVDAHRDRAPRPDLGRAARRPAARPSRSSRTSSATCASSASRGDASSSSSTAATIRASCAIAPTSSPRRSSACAKIADDYLEARPALGRRADARDRRARAEPAARARLRDPVTRRRSERDGDGAAVGARVADEVDRGR